MSSGSMVYVSIGEVKIGRDRDVLMASLGSCVGIGLFWKKRSLYGLAHCLLPEAPRPTADITARFVSQAIPSLITLMKISSENRNEIEAVVVGGGNMTAPRNVKLDVLVGALNAMAAKKYLQRFGFKVVHEDIGGAFGRKIEIFCESGEFLVKVVPRITSDAA